MNWNDGGLRLIGTGDLVALALMMAIAASVGAIWLAML